MEKASYPRSVATLKRWSGDHGDAVWMSIGAVTILSISSITDRPTPAQVLMVAPAVVMFIVCGFTDRVPAELFAAFVFVPVAVVVADGGALEGMFFLVDGMVLVTSWRLPSFRRGAAIAVVAVVTP